MPKNLAPAKLLELSGYTRENTNRGWTRLPDKRARKSVDDPPTILRRANKPRLPQRLHAFVENEDTIDLHFDKNDTTSVSGHTALRFSTSVKKEIRRFEQIDLEHSPAHRVIRRTKSRLRWLRRFLIWYLFYRSKT